MKSIWTRIAFLSLCLIGCARLGLATTVVVPSDASMIIGARAIVIGKVLSVATSFDSARGDIYSYVTVRVEDVLKGQLAPGVIVLREEGGTIGDSASVIFGTPQFTRSERVLLYLDTWPTGGLRVYQMFLGKFSIAEDKKTGSPIVQRQAGDDRVDVANGSNTGRVTDRASLSDYTRLVRDTLIANAKQSSEFQAKYYHQAPLLRIPLEYHPSAQAAIQPQFHLFPNPARWFEPDSGQPVVFMVDPDGEPNPNTIDDVVAAANAWSTVNGSLIRVVVGGNTDFCVQLTDATIAFNNCAGRFSPTPDCSGIIAVGGFYADYSQKVVVNGTSFGKIHGAFVSFNPYSACSFTEHCNVQETTTHEIGHTLGLFHSWQPSFLGFPTKEELDATMFFEAHFDGRCASLRTDDINGITFVYPASSGGLQIATVSPLNSATVGSAYSAPVVAAGEPGPFSWSLVSGKGMPPPGLNLGADGTISGTATTPGSYAFTVQVTDPNGHAAQKLLAITVNSAPLVLTVATLPAAVKDVVYTLQLMAAGGTMPETWSIQSGSLPPGLTLDPSTGLISGTPTEVGTFDFTAAVADPLPETSTAALELLVVGPNAVPHISSVRYKPGSRRLSVSGQNFDPAAVLKVDGNSVSIRGNSGTQLTVRGLTLSAGTHQIVVENPHELLSQSFTLTVP